MLKWVPSPSPCKWLLFLPCSLHETEPPNFHTHTQRHTNKSSCRTRYRDVSTGLKMVGGGEQTELLLRNIFKTLKASQCRQPRFSLALTVFPLPSLQNPSPGTRKTVLPVNSPQQASFPHYCTSFLPAFSIFSFLSREI